VQRISETKLISGVISISLGFFLLIKTALIIRTPENNVEIKIFFAVLGISLFILGIRLLKTISKNVVSVEEDAVVIKLPQTILPTYQEDVTSETNVQPLESIRLAEIRV
jgi:hypothetical protein